MGKVLCYFCQDMADFEVILSLHLLALQGKEIMTMSYGSRPVTGLSRAVYQADCTTKDAMKLEDVEGLIIPGGSNDEQRAELTQMIERLNAEHKLLAAICRGPVFLARAGVLEGRSYTTTYSKELAAELGVRDPFDRSRYRDAPVVRDGHVITARGNAFVDFAMEICDFFGYFDTQDEKAQTSRYFKGLEGS